MIRPAATTDIEPMLALSQTCFGAAWSRIDFVPSPLRWALVADSTIQACVGYLIMQVLGSEAELQALAVAPAERRRGIATELLAAAVEQARQQGVETIYLEVRASNQAAVEFYLRHHFERCGFRPEYYHAPVEAALLMRRDLR